MHREKVAGATKIPMQAEAHDISETIFRRILIAITLFAFVIRLVSIDHNLPYQIISDEGSDLTTTVNLLQGELPARHVRYHRMLIAYSNMLPIAGVFAVNFIDGDVRSVADFQNLYFSNRAEFIFATRLWMSVLTSFAILFAGLAASYVNRKTGLLAALILALNAFYFHTSLFALPDALGASMTALAIWTIMRVWKYRRTRDYIFMSMALALVMLSKLQASIIGVGFLVAHGYVVFEAIDRDWKQLPLAYFTNKNLWIAAIAGILANIVFNPIAFMDLNTLLYELRLTESNFGSLDSAIPLSYTVDILFREVRHLIIVMLRWITPFLLLALIPLWKRRLPAPHMVILSMIVATGLLIGRARLNPVSHFYYWNPVVIPVSIMGAIGVAYLLDVLQAINHKYATHILTGGIALLILLEGSFLWQMFNVMNSETTQELAREWIVENIEADSAIISGSPIIVSVPIQRNEESIQRAIDLRESSLSQWNWYLRQAEENRPSPAFELYGPEYLIAIDNYEDLETLIEEANIEYIVFTDYNCSGVDDDPAINSPLAYPPRSSEMTNNWELVFSVSSYASGDCDAGIHPRTKISFTDAIYHHVRTGPYIEIYSIPQS